MNTMDRKVFFIHIPKTAGSSFNTFLKGNFSGEDHCERYLCPDCETLVDLDRLKTFDYISGHLRLATFLNNEFLRDEYFLLTFLRNPFDQLISHLNWLMYIYDVSPDFFHGHPQQIQEASLELRSLDLYNPDTFISVLLKYRGFQNNQSRFFVDEPSSTEIGFIIEVIEQLDMVGITEYYKESLECFVTLNGLNADPVSAKINVNPGCRIDRSILDNPLIYEFLQNYNAIDIEIYNRALSKFCEISKGAVTSLCTSALASSCDNTLVPKDFNGQIYLSLNPDVEEVGMDPVKHFIYYGKAENRRYK